MDPDGPVEASSAGVNAMAIREGGTVSCGELVAGPTGDLALRPLGSAQTGALEDVVALSVVEQCP